MALLELQLSEQEKQLQQIQNNSHELQILRHDMKNYLLTYQALLASGEIDQVRYDINQMISERLSSSDRSYTHNLLLNSILLSRESICQSSNIPLQIHVVIPSDYQDIDTMVAILNLFDNAIEAEQTIPLPNRLIIVEIVQLPSGISIIIQNRITSSILANNSDLITSKTNNSRLHGLGLKSIRHLVEKREGHMDIYEDNSMFTVHIIL